MRKEARVLAYTEYLVNKAGKWEGSLSGSVPRKVIRCE